MAYRWSSVTTWATRLASTVLIATLLAAGAATAGTLRLPAGSAVFADPTEAAIAGLGEAATCSANRVECGGVIYRVRGGYTYTSPIEGEPYAVDLSGPYVAHEHDVVADFHVHICRYRPELSPFFSGTDIASSRGLKITSFILSLCDGYVRRFDPAGDPPDDWELDYSSGRVQLLTKGHIAGWINLRKPK